MSIWYFSHNDRCCHLPKYWHFLLIHPVFGRCPWYRIFLYKLVEPGTPIVQKVCIRRDTHKSYVVPENNQTSPKHEDGTSRDKNPCNLGANGRRLTEMRTKSFILQAYKRLEGKNFMRIFDRLWQWQQRRWQHGCQS
jgi:hypothetical protein